MQARNPGWTAASNNPYASTETTLAQAAARQVRRARGSVGTRARALLLSQHAVCFLRRHGQAAFPRARARGPRASVSPAACSSAAYSCCAHPLRASPRRASSRPETPRPASSRPETPCLASPRRASRRFPKRGTPHAHSAAAAHTSTSCPTTSATPSPLSSARRLPCTLAGEPVRFPERTRNEIRPHPDLSPTKPQSVSNQPQPISNQTPTGPQPPFE